MRHSKVLIDTFFHLFLAYDINSGKSFPAPKERSRSKYFEELANEIITFYEKTTPKPFNIKTNYSPVQLGGYLRKYSNNILINFNSLKGDTDSLNLSEEYFTLLYFYTFKEKYSGIKKHLELVSAQLLQTENGTSKSDKIKGNTLKDIFFNKLKDELSRKSSFLKDNKVIPWKKYFSEQLKIDTADISRVLSSHPSILSSLAGRSSSHMQVNECKEKKLFTKPENYLLCHGLSVHSDSILLLCDIGRFLRFKNIYNKECKVLLTDIDFARLNWKIQNFKEDLPALTESKIQQNLKTCLKFRSKLYKKAGLKIGNGTVETCSLENAHNKYFDKHTVMKQFEPLTKDKIESIAQEYNEFVKIILGDKFKDKQILDDEEKQQTLNALADFKSKMQSAHSITNLSFVKRDLTKHINIIDLVVYTYKSYSKDTFCYFYLQYLHQYHFPFHLKIAILREKDFDQAFSVLQKMDDIDESEYCLNGVYFKDYNVYLNGDKKSVIPYYFPSGNLDKDADNLQEAESTTVLIRDTNNIDKITEVYRTYKDINELSIIISDLMSFAHYFFMNDNSEYGKFNVKNELNKVFREFGEEFHKSWTSYTTADLDNFNKTLESFESHIFTHWGGYSITPYWFYPFIFNLSPDYDHERTIKVYAKFTKIVLQGLEASLGFSSGELQHWGIEQA